MRQKNNLRLKRWLAAALCGLTLSACTAPTAPITPQPSESERFAAFTRELFIDSVSEDGISLQYSLVDPAPYGISHQEVDTLGDFSLEAIEENEAEGEKLLAELTAFDRAQLTEEQRMTYDLMEHTMQLDKTADGMGLYVTYFNTRGLQSVYPLLLVDYRLANERDIESYLVLLADLPRAYAQGLELEKKRAAAGYYMSELVLDEVLKNGKEFLDKPEENALVFSFEERLEEIEGLSAEQKQKYIAENRAIWLEQVVPAHRQLMQELEALRPSCTKPLGLAHTGTQGKEFYAYLVRSSTGWDGTMEELIALIDKSMGESLRMVIFGQANSSGVFQEAMEFYDQPIALGTPQEMLSALEQKYRESFPAIEQVDYTLKEVSPGLQGSSAPAYYLTPPIDAPTMNFIYTNPSSKQLDMPQELFNTLSHEGFPGHLYQRNYFVQQKPEPLRSSLSFSGYSEGWAEYAAEQSYPWTGLSEKAAAIVRHMRRFDMLVMARADIGIHYEGWDRAQLEEFLKPLGVEDAQAIEEFLTAVLDDPTNPLPYIVGLLEFSQLRIDAQKQLGELFELKAFHQTVLDCGPAPFMIVRREVEKYIANQLPAESTSQKAA